MADVGHVGAFDRYQASLGLERAADTVAEAADRAGLDEVVVERFVADGRPQWWTFRAPVSWTPVTARLTLYAGPGPDCAELLSTDHAEQPFAVATYSASTPPGGVVAPLVRVCGDEPIGPEFAGAIAVVERPAYGRGGLVAELAAAGALGLVTDAPSKGESGQAHPGRIELAPDAVLFAFSLTPQALRRTAAAADRGWCARAEIAVDRTAGMPVVSGVLPGDESGPEIWLTGHLCHPRPGANDNASGVAALLGVARTLARLRRADARYGTRRPIRFFWGPEYLGNAAVLHSRSGSSSGPGRPLPEALINLDMVGEDQERCRSPFVVERPPETTPTLLGPLAEHVVERVFRATADRPGRWTASPFLGFSDHALYADPSVDRPAVQFCHPADRFNHSAADSPDKVSPVEMLRSTAAATVLAYTLASGGPDPAALAGVVRRWCRREQEVARGLLRERDDEWSRGLYDHVQRWNATLLALALTGAAPQDRLGPADRDLGRPVRACWDGPLNVRAMLSALPAATRAVLDGMIADDKRHLSVLFNLAIRADGRRDRETITGLTSFGFRRPLPREATDRLFDALLASGWLAEV
ncbi:M28 family peptidase [Streptomyces sp. NPDC050619]|uniref:M28 family peptidase n=1 Tax=Streptomyces sp. NPDC050619 TaxID=3157214 RepID=UPI003441AA8D